MDLSKREQVAIAILVACARNGPAFIHTEIAAAAADTTLVQAAQLVHQLQRVHLLETARGRFGGIRLARCAEQITLDDVLTAIAARRRIQSKAASGTSGALAAIAQAAIQRARETYASFTIADLAREQVADKLSCFGCSIRLHGTSSHHRKRSVASPGLIAPV